MENEIVPENQEPVIIDEELVDPETVEVPETPTENPAA